ncbi:MAG: hypothetical protein SVZ03_00130 [Spirochaetota bacterium]|nr:hypothetical protein [Spirochaetota bacterium]
MKKILCTIAFLTIYFFPSTNELISREAKKKIFHGRVICVNSDNIEIKRGKIELILYFTENTRYIKMDKTEGSKGIIEICQEVKAYYIKEKKKNMLVKIVILKNSDCF